MKSKKGTIQLFINDVEKNVKSLITEHKNLIVESTTYTTKVKLNSGVNYLFAESGTSKNTFIAHNKIKSDLKQGDFKPFEVKKGINYFGFRENLSGLKDMVCIDINCAYPTELKKQNFISQTTFEYLTKRIEKIDRLRSLGMLATNKTIQEIENARLVNLYNQENPTACVFFSVSHAVGEILNFLFYAYPDYVYFYWVDGIFINPVLIDTVCEFFDQNLFTFKIEPVENFQVKKTCLMFDKWHVDKFEKKILFFPRQKTRISKEIYNFIT